MVKKITKLFIYFIFFILALIVFMPKSSLYFFGEKNLKQFSVIVSDEKIKEGLFSLSLSDITIYAKGVDSAKVKKVDATLMLIYNSIDITDIEISSVAAPYLPTKIKNVDISYTIFNPLVVNAVSNGEFGEAKAKFDIIKRELKVYLKPSKKMLRKYTRSLRYFKKDTKGEYVYAKTF